MTKVLMITADSEQDLQRAWQLLGEQAGLYGDNGGDPDGNAWLPSMMVTEEEAAEIIASGLGGMVGALYASDEAMLRYLGFAPLSFDEELEEETVERMKLEAEEQTAAWAHYGAYGAADSTWVFCELIPVSVLRLWRGEEPIGYEEYIVLTCTAHGTPLWRVGDLDVVAVDRGVYNPPPMKIFGPYLIGKDGYRSIEEAVENDAELPDLDDPTTWSDDPRWNRHYADTGEHPEDW